MLCGSVCTSVKCDVLCGSVCTSVKCEGGCVSCGEGGGVYMCKV